MSLPRRNHFSVFEVTARWGITTTDVRYYLESGLLQAQVLLAEKLAQVYHRLETPEKEEAWVKKSILRIGGYVVIQPEQLRTVFRLKSASIHKFRAVEGPEHYKLLREREITPIGVEDLWISSVECTRFEREHGIANELANGSKTGIVVNAAGRPSIMQRITERYQERIGTGEALPSVAAEAKLLRSWAQQSMPGVQIPSVKTIRNQLYSAGAERAECA